MTTTSARPRPYRTYTAEQRRQALAIVGIAGETVAARGLELPRSIVHYWARAAGVSGPPPAKMRHGTRSPYKAGCRCERCTTAQRDGAQVQRSGGRTSPVRRSGGRTSPVRSFSLRPLLAAAGLPRGQSGHHVRASGSALRQADAEGLAEAQADAWACRLGLHPSNVWPEWWDRASVPT